MCSLQWVLLGLNTHICGCSIINSRWALTAAHCITESPTIGRIDILVGAHNINNAAETTRQTLGNLQAIVHEDYAGGVAPHDIALFFLDSVIIFNDFVKTIGLSTAPTEALGASTLSGWGSTSTTTTPINPSILQKAVLPIIPMATCFALIGGSTPLNAQANICTGPVTGGLSACSGDSGGPLIQYAADGTPTQIGIVSWGFTPCGSVNAPSVYGNVANYVPWIANKTGIAF